MENSSDTFFKNDFDKIRLTYLECNLHLALSWNLFSIQRVTVGSRFFRQKKTKKSQVEESRLEKVKQPPGPPLDQRLDSPLIYQ